MINQKPFISFMHNKSYIDMDGTQYWLDEDNMAHSYNDKPAAIYKDGTKEWYNHGKLHRDDRKPARIFPNGQEQYWKNNKRQFILH